MIKLAGEGSEMSFCLGKRFSLGVGNVTPKPQDACALPRKKQSWVGQKYQNRDAGSSISASQKANLQASRGAPKRLA